MINRTRKIQILLKILKITLENLLNKKLSYKMKKLLRPKLRLLNVKIPDKLQNTNFNKIKTLNSMILNKKALQLI